MHGIKKSSLQQNAAEKEISERKLRMYKEIGINLLDLYRNNVYNEDVLNTTSHLLILNPDHHMIWTYRRKIILYMLQEKKIDQEKVVIDELKITKEALMRNPKSYQTWYHRQWVTTRMDCDLKNEIFLCGSLLDLDERNFHCWNYRRHLVEQTKIEPAEEINFSNKKIIQNFSNYSAFHHRTIYFLKFPNLFQLDKEIATVKQAVFTEPDDQTAWFYFRWLLYKVVNDQEKSIQSRWNFLTNQLMWIQELSDLEDNISKWPLLFIGYINGLLVKAYMEESFDTRKLVEEDLNQIEERKKKCLNVYQSLLSIDPDHSEMYKYELIKIKSMKI